MFKSIFRQIFIFAIIGALLIGGGVLAATLFSTEVPSSLHINTIGSIEVIPAVIDFGDADPGGETAMVTISVTNTGNANVSLYARLTDPENVVSAWMWGPDLGDFEDPTIDKLLISSFAPDGAQDKEVTLAIDADAIGGDVEGLVITLIACEGGTAPGS